MRYINKSKLFIGGVVLFFISSSLLWISVPVTRILQLISIALFTWSFRIKSSRNIKFPILYKVLILSVLLWGLLIIIRGDYSSAISILRKIYNTDGIFEYIAPLLLFFPLYKYFDYIRNIFVKVLYLYIILIFTRLPMIILKVENIIPIISDIYSFLGGSLPFLIIFYKYLSQKQKIIVFIASALMGLVAIWLARRSMVLILSLSFMFYLFIWLTEHKYRLIKLIFVGIIAVVIYCYLLPVLFNLSFFQSITNKGLSDTRTIVETYLWDDINLFNTVLYGKGIDGTYYAPNIDQISAFRSIIETGYLHLILKGGIVYLILLGLIFVLPIIRGLLLNRSTVSTCAVLYLLYCICMMYPGNPCRFVPTYFLMWLCVSLIYSENPKTRIIAKSSKRFKRSYILLFFNVLNAKIKKGTFCNK
jgi:hypothetical protein